MALQASHKFFQAYLRIGQSLFHDAQLFQANEAPWGALFPFGSYRLHQKDHRQVHVATFAKWPCAYPYQELAHPLARQDIRK